MRCPDASLTEDVRISLNEVFLICPGPKSRPGGHFCQEYINNSIRAVLLPKSGWPCIRTLNIRAGRCSRYRFLLQGGSNFPAAF